MSASTRSPQAWAAAAALACALAATSQISAQQAEPAPAAEPAPKWYEEISLNGFISASWSHNFNRPASGTNQLRAFDVDDGSIRLDVAQLVLQRPATASGQAGFRVDALAGASVPRVTAAYGLFRDPDTGESGDFDLLQAFVRWVAPLGRGLTLDAGKFVTSSGFEAIEGYEAWNDHATHSFLFGLSEPSTHTGLKAGYAFSDGLSAELLLVNGWDDADDVNGSKTVGGGVTWTPGSGVTLTANVLYGPERKENDDDPRSLVGIVARGKAAGGVDVAVHLERGSEQGLGPGGETATWWGVAGYVRWEVSPAFSLALRVERLRDADGVRTAAAQTLHEVTLTPAVSLASGLVLRADFRVDFSDRDVFEDEGGLLTKRRQATLLLNALYAF